MKANVALKCLSLELSIEEIVDVINSCPDVKVCKKATHVLNKKGANFLFVMSNTNYNPLLFKFVANHLKGTVNESDIQTIMRQSGFKSEICEIGTFVLSKKKKESRLKKILKSI
jgi:hypothetical protein